MQGKDKGGHIGPEFFCNKKGLFMLRNIRFLAFITSLVFIIDLNYTFAQTNDEKKTVVPSFKKFIANHINSYKTNHHARVALTNNGWRNVWYDADPNYSIDVQTTNSLISPFAGFSVFTLQRHISNAHPTREDAKSDTIISSTSIVKHKHAYAYQDGKWIVTERRFYGASLDKWYDCNEVIMTGDDTGATELQGCFEQTGK